MVPGYPSYEMNGGLLNLLGIWDHSFLSENSDQAALRNAQLMVSMAAFWGLRRSGETESLSMKSHDLCLDRREPNWRDASIWLALTLTKPLGDSLRFFLRCDPVPPTPSPLPICEGALILDPSYNAALTWGLRTPTDTSMMTPLLNQSVPCLTCVFGLHFSYVSFPANLSPETSP